MRSLPLKDVVDAALPFLKERGYDVESGAWLDKLIANTRERFRTLVELADHVSYFFGEPEAYDEKARGKWFEARNR
ncbi:MAG: hypothetical protein M5R36_02025 [Deltaproteobacteria bacterium]|nr:hypothetical protein [Deltaproteobacteria bacterium]